MDKIQSLDKVFTLIYSVSRITASFSASNF